MPGPSFGVIVFPGTNCDRDAYWVIEEVIGKKVRYVWHTESDIDDIDVVIIPGGFSYGDHLRAGAIARFSPVMKSVVKHAGKSKPVLGICNGFQVLAECGLIRGAFLRNKIVHFLCRHQHLKVKSSDSLFTKKYTSGQVLKLPIAHAEGNFFLADDDRKFALDHGLIAFQYCDTDGKVDDSTNPNGAILGIAGIFNDKKNVLGMMPHPERASEPEMGSTDGRAIFESIVEGFR
ncbi:MAG: phosphoribosylformylglycinamidine synthase I [Spirochaetes bacterium GWF1_51_8]|nr:MAG: phosphoribosylformylglycinamidine synthase I [Spirochaetes bacterium GWF1_51_8]